MATASSRHAPTVEHSQHWYKEEQQTAGADPVSPSLQTVRFAFGSALAHLHPRPSFDTRCKPCLPPLRGRCGRQDAERLFTPKCIPAWPRVWCMHSVSSASSDTEGSAAVVTRLRRPLWHGTLSFLPTRWPCAAGPGLLKHRCRHHPCPFCTCTALRQNVQLATHTGITHPFCPMIASNARPRVSDARI